MVKIKNMCRLNSCNEPVPIHQMKRLKDGSLEYIPQENPTHIDSSHLCLVIDQKITSALHFYIENYAYVEDWCEIIGNGCVGWILSKHLQDIF